MVEKKKNKKTLNFPKVKKEVKDFLADDQGKMTRKDVAKLGVSLAVLGMMMQPGTSQADNTTYATPTHQNTVDVKDNCATHSNITTEVAHHSNHNQGGWMC